MTLAATASLENVKASLERYIKDTLEGVDRLTVAWQGTAFRTEDHEDWIEPYMVGPTRMFHRQVSSTERGNTVNLLYQLDAYVKRTRAYPVDAHKLIKLRDKILGRFKENVRISLKDYAADGNPELSKMIIRSTVTDQHMPSADPGLQRWTVAVIIQYLEKY